MGDQDKRKLCWNCEGSVLRHLESCPYCGVYLSPSEQDSSHSLLSPPYPSSFSKASSTIPKPIYQPDNAKESSEAEETQEEESEEGSTSILSPLLYFIVGSSFGLFGLSLWLFSEKGRLTLSWSDDWAPVFLLVALLMLVLGGRSIVKLQDS